MSPLYDPADRGFPAAFTSVDRAQMAMLRELASSGGRLVLKGGMAMRTVVGSMRLTKDVDFDRAAGASTNAIKGMLRRALTFGAQSARLLGARIDDLKSTETTVRMRLTGDASGQRVQFMVEVSGRRTLPEDFREAVTVVPPARYGIAPFSIVAYTHDMLAASKVAAVLSPNRNVPRDVYDLNDLVGSSPAGILGAHFDHNALQRWRDEAVSKISAIAYAQARDELLPYIPPEIRGAFTEPAWDDMTLAVAGQVERWLSEALKLQHRPE